MKSKTLAGILAGLSLGSSAVQPAIAQEKTLFELLKPYVDESGGVNGTTLDRAVSPDHGYERITLKLPNGQILTVYYAISTGRLNDLRHPYLYSLHEGVWGDTGPVDKYPDGLNGNEKRIW